GSPGLNVAKVVFFDSGSGRSGIEGLSPSRPSIADSSDNGPALASHNGRLFLAWEGRDGDHSLNLMFSNDNGASFGGKKVFGDSKGGRPACGERKGGVVRAGRRGRKSSPHVRTESFCDKGR